MALYEQKWWTKIWGKKTKHSNIDPLEDVQAVQEFLDEVQGDVQRLRSQLQKVEELEKERQIITRENLLLVNLETQAEALDKLLQEYQFFQEDADVNGLRVKRVAAEFLKQAEKAGLNNLAREKRKDLKWRFDW